MKIETKKKKTCKNCKWFKPVDRKLFSKTYLDNGELIDYSWMDIDYCKRYPTAIRKKETDFCGEFEPKTPKVAH